MKIQDIKIGVPVKLDFDSRYFELNRDYAIRDIYDALVELVTNADDSYHRMYEKHKISDDGSPILIEIGEQRGGGRSRILVRDRAEGMTFATMFEKLYNVGKRMSEKGDRGFMGRGAKDCTALGDLTYESIRDERYYSCKITNKGEFVRLTQDRGEIVDRNRRDLMRISHGNGTVVTIETIPSVKIPRIETLVRDLPWYYSLRDVLSENSPTKLKVRNLNRPDEITPVIHYASRGEKILSETFIVPSYDHATAKLTLWKLENDPGYSVDRFRRSGIIVKSERAIFECSLLFPGFENDDLARKYIGRIECPYIDTLLEEYDSRRADGEVHSSENPKLLIDPNRISGQLRRDHPFTQSLYKIPKLRLQELVEKDRQLERKEAVEVANHETQKRLNDLAKEASKFLSQQVENIEEIADGDESDNEYFSKRGVTLFPTFLNIKVGQVRTLTLYVNKKVFNQLGFGVKIKSDDSALEVMDTTCYLRNHKSKGDTLIGTLRVKGVSIQEAVCLQTDSPELPRAESIANVVEAGTENHLFSEMLEFEHKKYVIKEGLTRTLRVFAKYPELVTDDAKINVTSSDVSGLPVKRVSTLTPVEGSNFAVAEITVQGRRQGKGFHLTANLGNYFSKSQVHVLQKEDPGLPLEIKIVPHHFGVYRAQWSSQNPNLLEISAEHESLKRYLGPSPDFYGQDLPHFRLLLAEIVAERICMKALEEEVKQRPWEFKDDLKSSPDVAVNSIITHLHRRFRDFVGKAHQIMLVTSDLKTYEQKLQE